MQGLRPQSPTFAFIAPFLAYLAFLAVGDQFSVPKGTLYLVRFVVVAGLLLLYSRPYLGPRPAHLWGSLGIGVLVFVLWVAPDLLLDYRHHWLFENFITGRVRSTIPEDLRRNMAFVMMRTVSCSLLVPTFEELFWRGWLMRWLVQKEFLKVPLGTYTPSVFWIVALLFASEHGPYWDVGLAAGVLYTWWMVHCRNLADCILAHAVTNALLSAFVLYSGRWEYWY